MSAGAGSAGAPAGRALPVVGRRRFLGLFTASLGVVAGGACATLASVRAPLEGGRLRLRVADHPGLAGAGGSLRVLPDGWAVPILLLADGDGWSAVSPVCTHLGCWVEVEGAQLVCPCHGSTYRRSGAVVRGPAERPLATFPVLEDPPGTLVVEVASGRPAMGGAA